MTWLKMDHATPEKPEVLAITVRMGWDDPDLTVGKLFRLWRWFDQQTTDGNALSVSAALLDRIVGVSGFCDAVHSVGWLCINPDGVSLPNFDRHNGQTAKDRANTAKRVAKHTAKRSPNAQANGASVSPSVSAPLPREEKNREEESSSLRSEDAAQKRVHPVPRSELVADGLSEEVADAWLAHRKAKKAKLTPIAWSGFKAEAVKAGWSVEAAVLKAIARNWTSFEAAWVANERPNGQGPPGKPPSAAEIRMFQACPELADPRVREYMARTAPQQPVTMEIFDVAAKRLD